LAIPETNHPLRIEQAKGQGNTWLNFSLMSAFGGKADIIQGAAKSPLIAISGHAGGGYL